MQNLAGKTAIVTGGASGIGLGISRALLAAGMNVAIGDVQVDALNAASVSLNNSYRVLATPLDVTDRDAFSAFVDLVEARFGHIHLLVNNAGVVVSGSIAQASFSDWDWVIDVNLKGTINGIVTVLPRMLSHGEGGHILNTASTSGLLPHPGAAIYVTTKAAQIAMTEAMRCELEPQGVMVSVLCPGPVQSQISDSARNRPAEYAQSGYADKPADKPTEEQIAAATQLMMTADEVGTMVREGIEKDYLYIITHAEYADGLQQRAEAIQSALPDQPQSEALKQMMAAAMSNPALNAEIERRKK